VARFRQMIENAPENMPRIMPMTGAIAPAFAARYPEASIIFDNLHSMHDVVSDILANDNVPRREKRSRILEAARRYRDDSSFVTTIDEWREMAQMMGVENMGGPAVGFLPQFPTPTVERGAVMAGMDHSKMRMPADSVRSGAMDHSRMAMPGARATDSARIRPDSARTTDHARMGHETGDGATAPAAYRTRLAELYMLLLGDSATRARLLRDSTSRRLLREMLTDVPEEHRAHFEELLAAEPPPPAATRPPSQPARRPPASAKPAQPTTKPAPKPADPHAGHGTPKPPPKPPAKKPPSI
jgi:hypothetical protein